MLVNEGKARVFDSERRRDAAILVERSTRNIVVIRYESQRGPACGRCCPTSSSSPPFRTRPYRCAIVPYSPPHVVECVPSYVVPEGDDGRRAASPHGPVRLWDFIADDNNISGFDLSTQDGAIASSSESRHGLCLIDSMLRPRRLLDHRTIRARFPRRMDSALLSYRDYRRGRMTSSFTIRADFRFYRRFTGDVMVSDR